MLTVYKPNMPLDKMAEQANAIADAEKNKANIDYVAMMCDVDIPTED